MVSSTQVLQGGNVTSTKGKQAKPISLTANRIQGGNIGFGVNQSGGAANQQHKKELPPQTLGVNTGSGDPNTDPALAALYDEQLAALRGLLGSTDTALTQGRTSISDSYNRGMSRYNEDQSKVLRDIGIKREETAADKRERLGDLDDELLQRSKGVKRMFAKAGSGISGASQILAPQAIGNQFSDMRGDVFGAFGRNQRQLDTAETDTKDQYKRGVEDLGIQRNQGLSSLESGIGEQRISINDQMREAAYNRARALGGGANEARTAMAPYSSEVERLKAALSSLFEQYRNPALNVNPINVSIPQLEAYLNDPVTGQLASTGQAQGVDESLMPYFPLMRRTEESLI
jgi:hypothetical protein